MCACVYVFAKSAYLYDKAKNHNNLYVLLIFFCCAFFSFFFICFVSRPLLAIG